MTRRSIHWLALGTTLVVLSACRVETDVSIAAEADGSGDVVVTVALDGAAAARFDDAQAQILVEDVADAGWVVDGPNPAGDGLTISATKAFGSAAELNSVLAEIGRDGGVNLTAEMDNSPSFGRERITATVDVESTGDLTAFSDSEVATLLDGEALGRPVDEILDEMGDNPSSPMSIQLDLAGDRAEGTIDLVGAPDSVTVQAVHDIRHQRPVQLVVVGLGGAAFGLLVLVIGSIVGRRRRRA